MTTPPPAILHTCREAGSRNGSALALQIWTACGCSHNKPAAAQPRNSYPKTAVEPQPLGSAMPWSTTPYPCRCGPKTRAPAWNRGPLSPQPIRPPWKETKLRPDTHSPPRRPGRVPLILVVWANKPHYTQHRYRRGHLPNNPMGPVTSKCSLSFKDPPQRQGGMG